MSESEAPPRKGARGIIVGELVFVRETRGGWTALIRRRFHRADGREYEATLPVAHFGALPQPEVGAVVKVTVDIVPRRAKHNPTLTEPGLQVDTLTVWHGPY